MEEIQRPLEVIETEINFYKNQTATGIIEIGKRLIEAKAQLPHGEWGKWLEEKVDFSNVTATRFMRVSNECSNISALKDLPQTKIFALLDVPQDQREEFIDQNKVDEMTTRELQKAIKENNELQRQLDAERDKPAKVIKERIEVPPHGYGTLKTRIEIKEREIERLNRDKEFLESKVKGTEKDAEEYNRLKEQIKFLHKEKDDLGRRIESATELSGLAVKIDNFLKTELAPIRYSRCFERMDSGEVDGNEDKPWKEVRL